MIDLSIILVNWNSLAFAEECIRSIEATVEQLAYEVIVIDNASGDAPCQSLRDRFPSVKLTLAKENLGFGGANNLGTLQSSGNILLFLNPDTVVRGDAIRRMFDELVARPEAGAIGCRLLNPDLSLQTSSVQSFPTVLNQLLAVHILQRLWPRLPLWGKRSLYAAPGKTVHRVDVVSGACLMVRREVFEQVGGFNPAYFMYAEEVDLCSMIRAAGKQVLHCSRAEVLHFGGQSTRQREDGFAEMAMRDSVYRFLLRTRGRVSASAFRVGSAVSAGIRLGLIAASLPLAMLLNQPRFIARAKKIRRKWTRIGHWAFHVPKDQSQIPLREGRREGLREAASPMLNEGGHSYQGSHSELMSAMIYHGRSTTLEDLGPNLRDDILEASAGQQTGGSVSLSTRQQDTG